MKYLIIGAGGVGGTLAACMFKGGLDVTLALTPQRYAAVSKSGLTFTGFDGVTEVLRVASVQLSGAAELDWDAAFICVKSYQLESVLRSIKNLPEKTVLIPVMNGIGNAGRLRDAMPGHTVIDSCVYLGAFKRDYNWVQQDNEGIKLVLDRYAPLADALSEELSHCGVKVKLSQQIGYDKFLKLFFISPLAAVEARYNASNGEVYYTEDMRAAFMALTRELYGCALALGYPLPENAPEMNETRLGKMPRDGFASMAKDYLEGRQYERSVIVDEALALGESTGTDMALYKKFAAEIKQYQG